MYLSGNGQVEGGAKAMITFTGHEFLAALIIGVFIGAAVTLSVTQLLGWLKIP